MMPAFWWRWVRMNDLHRSWPLSTLLPWGIHSNTDCIWWPSLSYWSSEAHAPTAAAQGKSERRTCSRLHTQRSSPRGAVPSALQDESCNWSPPTCPRAAIDDQQYEHITSHVTLGLLITKCPLFLSLRAWTNGGRARGIYNPSTVCISDYILVANNEWQRLYHIYFYFHPK